MKKMRSDLIFDSLTAVQNRYTLCQLAAKATRKFHKPNTRIQETMNEVLTRFGKVEAPGQVMTATEKLAEAERRAA